MKINMNMNKKKILILLTVILVTVLKNTINIKLNRTIRTYKVIC